jgi:hypothetical protein
MALGAERGTVYRLILPRGCPGHGRLTGSGDTASYEVVGRALLVPCDIARCRRGARSFSSTGQLHSGGPRCIGQPGGSITRRIVVPPLVKLCRISNSCHSYQLRLCEPVSEEKRLAYGSQATSRVVGRRTSMLPRYPRSILCLTSSRALNPISMNGISLVNLTMDSRIVRKLECAAFGLPAYLDRG